MNALHSYSNSQTSSYLLGLRRKKYRSPFGVFRNNEYIKKLNYQLALELGVIDLYSRLHHPNWKPVYDKCMENHQEIASILVNLIMGNHGIPNKDATTLPTELSLIANRLGQQLGSVVGAKTSSRICLTMEQSLRKRYCELIEIAPLRDKTSLNQVLLFTKANLISLYAASNH